MRHTRTEKPQLAKRGKSVCSYCGKKTFVNYIFSDGTPVADGVCGKCDRADNCGVHYPPREYFKDNNKDVSSRQTRRHSLRPQPKKVEPTFIDAKHMLESIREFDRNPFVKFLHSSFDSNAGAEIPNIVDSTAKRYAVGTSTKYGGSTVFWQVDQNGRVRSGQIMGYDATTGKRDHQKQNWVHSVMSDKYPDFNLEQCFFGSHVINRFNRGEIWLMESPKAAVILSIVLQWGGVERLFVPMATFGSEGLNPTFERKRNLYDKHQVLKNRRVVLFPDNGKFEEWQARGKMLQGFAKEVYISTVMEQELHPYKLSYHIRDGDGFDDAVLHYVKNGLPIWDLINTCYGYCGKWKIV